jgi:hypothetical protein
VHDLYFEPQYEEIPAADDLASFQPVHFRIQGTGFNSQCKATAKLGEFLEARFAQSF